MLLLCSQLCLSYHLLLLLVLGDHARPFVALGEGTIQRLYCHKHVLTVQIDLDLGGGVDAAAPLVLRHIRLLIRVRPPHITRSAPLPLEVQRAVA